MSVLPSHDVFSTGVVVMMCTSTFFACDLTFRLYHVLHQSEKLGAETCENMVMDGAVMVQSVGGKQLSFPMTQARQKTLIIHAKTHLMRDWSHQNIPLVFCMVQCRNNFWN